MKRENTWFVYTQEIVGDKECLIASNLSQLEAQELCDEYRRNLERNCPNEYVSYGDICYDVYIAKRLGLV